MRFAATLVAPLLLCSSLSAIAQTAPASFLQMSLEVLKEKLNSDDANVRYAAELALGERGPEAIPVAIEILKASDGKYKYQARSVLKRIGPAAVGTLMELLESSSADVRNEGAIGLGVLGTKAKDAVPKLLALFKNDPDKSVRGYAGQALGRIGPDAKEAVPVMIEALGNRERYEPSSVMWDLGAIGPDAAEAVPVIKKAMEEGDERVRQYGVWALERIEKRVRDDFEPQIPPVLENPGEYAPPVLVKVFESPDAQAKPQVLKKEIPSQQAGYRHYEYEVKVDEFSEPVFLAKFYQYQKDREYQHDEFGLDESSLDFRWLQTDALLLIRWTTWPLGQGVCHVQTHLILARKGAQWLDIFRDTQPAYCRHSDLVTYRFNYDQQTALLTIDEDDCSEVVQEDWPQDTGSALSKGQVTYLTQWQFKLTQGKLQYLGGKKSVDLDKRDINVSSPEKETRTSRTYGIQEVAAFLSPDDPLGMTEKIRKLNPQLQGKDTCTGLVLFNDRVTWRGADSKHYYSAGGEAPF